MANISRQPLPFSCHPSPKAEDLLLSFPNRQPRREVQPLEPHPIFRDFIAASYQNHLRLTPTAETESQFERDL